MRALNLIAPLALFLGLGAVPAAAEPVETAAIESAETSSGWKAKAKDNIAGLSDLKKVSNPAVVDYDKLLAATAEMKQIKRDKIDPDSPKGRSLRQQAVERVTKAAEAIRSEKRHCSVWKAISHKDGRKVADITKAVQDKLGSV